VLLNDKLTSHTSTITTFTHLYTVDGTNSNYNSTLDREVLKMTLTFDLWPLSWKTFSAVLTHMMNICGKFHWNPFT